MHVRVETVVVGEFGVNCFVVWGTEPQAIVIDPGADAENVQDVLARHKLGVAAYVLTHGHVDHVSGLADLYTRHPAPIAMHRADAAWAFTAQNALLPFYPMPRCPAAINRYLADGTSFADAGLSYAVIATPGHTPGGICLHFVGDRLLFTGDTLFAGSVGRTDLPGGDGRALAQSLKALARLPDDTAVCPGHGPETTIGQEKRTNPFLNVTGA